MTTEQLLSADSPEAPAPTPETSGLVEAIRSSYELVASQAEDLSRHFYATLFTRAPETRDLFPANMEVQRSRLLRALVHVVQMVDQPDELIPFLQQLGKDHRKFGVIARHYSAVGDALIGAIARYSGDAWTPEVEKAWTDAYDIVSAAMRLAAEGERGPATWSARVVAHRRIGWELAVVTVQTDQPVPYLPGQYLSVETPMRPRLWRYLSPANAPRPDNTLEFHVRSVPNGWASRAIVAHSEVGQTWRIGPPMGRMSLNPDSGRDLLMVAGGTGMAPIKALLDDLVRRPKDAERPRVQVFVGGRTWEDLYDFPALRTLSYDHPWLDVVPVVEEEDGTSGAEQGTLADVIARYGSWADHDVLVCGSPTMIRATVSRMLVAGTPLDRISYDPFTLD
ncbi:MAG: FAD-binding oxidoreductase [Pseudonocardia sp.]|nr:FAD-binding oxidoreductase [Pseudonocardia sp.]